MQKDKFGDAKTGKLASIHTPNGTDWAFVPNPLPRSWNLSPETVALLGDARESLGTLDGIGQTLRNHALLLSPLQNQEALKSSSLEGTYITPIELYQHVAMSAERQASQDTNPEWREVANYGVALRVGQEELETLLLSGRLIRNMHRILLTGVRGTDKRPGEFRRSQVHVGSDRRYIPPPADVALDCFADLERFLNPKRDDEPLNPIIRAIVAHYQFEAIHPFHDGNGRIGRVLFSLSVGLWHGHKQPWLYLSPYFDSYKDEYISKLFNVSAKGEWEQWIQFCLRGVVEQCRVSIELCKALNKLQAGYEDDDQLSLRQKKILLDSFEHPVFTVAEAKKWCDVSRPTAVKDLDDLVVRKLLTVDERHPRSYYNMTLFHLAFPSSF